MDVESHSSEPRRSYRLPLPTTLNGCEVGHLDREACAFCDAIPFSEHPQT